VRSKVDRVFWEGMGRENRGPDRFFGIWEMREDPEARRGMEEDGDDFEMGR